jgi:hypothetical protein
VKVLYTLWNLRFLAHLDHHNFGIPLQVFRISALYLMDVCAELVWTGHSSFRSLIGKGVLPQEAVGSAVLSKDISSSRLLMSVEQVYGLIERIRVRGTVSAFQFRGSPATRRLHQVCWEMQT